MQKIEGRMHKTNIPILEIVAATALVAIAVTVILLLFPPMNNETSAAWTGALGTLLALVGTIFLATQETRRRKREELTRAKITAPSISMKISLLRPKMVMAIESLRQQNNPSRHSLLFLGQQLSEPNLWTLDELVPLACLPNSCAINLALVLEIISIVSTAFTKPPEELGRTVPDGLALLVNGLAHLDAALSTCTSVYEMAEYDSAKAINVPVSFP